MVGGHGKIAQAWLATRADHDLKNRAGYTAVTLAQDRGAAHLLEQPTPDPSSGEVASLLDRLEKRALEKEQLRHEVERQQAQSQNHVRLAENAPPPRITLQQPASAQHTRGLVVADADFRVAGTVSDDARTRTLFINGKPISLDTQGRFSHTMRLGQGNNTIVFNALDALGRSVELSITARSSTRQDVPSGQAAQRLRPWGRPAAGNKTGSDALGSWYDKESPL